MITKDLKRALDYKFRYIWAQTKELQGALTLGALYDDLAPAEAQSVQFREPLRFTNEKRKFAIYAQTNQLNTGNNLKRWKNSDTGARRRRCSMRAWHPVRRCRD